MDIENPTVESLSIEWTTIDYNQIENKLFMQIEIMPGNENIDSVYVEVTSENYDSTFLLNDNGVLGDLSSFFNWAEDSGLISLNPVKLLALSTVNSNNTPQP